MVTLCREGGGGPLLACAKGVGAYLIYKLYESGKIPFGIQNSLYNPWHDKLSCAFLFCPVLYRSLGCLEDSCVLCQYNTERRCRVNFANKYLVNDRLTARCSAPIRIELLDSVTGQLYEGDTSNIQLEVGAVAWRFGPEALAPPES